MEENEHEQVNELLIILPTTNPVLISIAEGKWDTVGVMGQARL